MMPKHLNPDSARDPVPGAASESEGDHRQLRSLSRSPHPYHHLNADIPHAAHRLVYRTPSAPAAIAAPAPATTAPKSDDSSEPSSPFPTFTKESTPASESGTEADDEHFLKGLPAPKARLHKGLRGRNEHLSGTSTPTYSSAVLEQDEPRPDHADQGPKGAQGSNTMFWEDRNFRRTKELIRRALEFVITAALLAIVSLNQAARPVFAAWSLGIVPAVRNPLSMPCQTD